MAGGNRADKTERDMTEEIAEYMAGETRGDMTGWYMELEMRKYMAEWTGN